MECGRIEDDDDLSGQPVEFFAKPISPLLQFAAVDQSTIELTAEEAAFFDESIAQADQGEFTTNEQVPSVGAKHGL
jgi:hypothetical protein